MTITSMARHLGVSTMTVYRRCKRRGIVLKDLRDQVSGELTSDGVTIIASLFDVTTPQMDITSDATQTAHDNNSDTQTASQGAAAADMAVQVAALTATVDGLRMLVDALTNERDNLRQQLQEAQAERRETQRLLNAGRDHATGGWFHRLFKHSGST